MKTTFLCVAAVLAALLLVSATVWEGVTDVAFAKDLPRAYSIATNSFPRNTVVDVTNLENGKMVRVIVISSLDTTGLLATLSRNAADAIDLRHDSTCRIRMTQSLDNTARVRGAPPPVLQLGPIDSSGAVASTTEDEAPASRTPATNNTTPASRPAATESAPVANNTPPANRSTATESAPVASRTPATETAPAANRSAATNNTTPASKPAATESAPVASRTPVTETAPAASRSTATNNTTPASKPAATESAPVASRTPATESAPVASRSTPTETAPVTAKPPVTESAPAAAASRPAAVSIIAADELPAIDDVTTAEESDAIDDVIAIDEPAVIDNAIAVSEPAVIDNVTVADVPDAIDDIIAIIEPVVTDNAVAASEPAEAVTEDQPEPRIASGTLTLVPADERVPPAHEQPTTASRDTAPHGVASRTAAPETAVSRTVVPTDAAPPVTQPVETPAAYAPSAEFSPFQAPLISSLEQGKWYVQIGVYSRPDNVEDEISRIGATYPVAIQNIGSDTSPMFRVLLGPLNQGESGAMLQRFKSIGYADAFVRHN